jgi:hypothetical protein
VTCVTVRAKAILNSPGIDCTAADRSRIGETIMNTLANALTENDLGGVCGGHVRGHHVCGDSELSMMQLQSMVSQRTLAVQLATSLMGSMNDAMKSIVGNIK